MADYLLFEEATGYALFKVAIQPEEIGARLKEVQQASADFGRFGKMLELVSFQPFKGAAQALQNANDVSEGIVNDYLKEFLQFNLPKSSNSTKVTLGISDRNFGQSIKDALPGIEPVTSEAIMDLLRGVRLFATKLLNGLEKGDVERAQLGLGHAYSRAKVKFSVNKDDNHIIQAIALLDQLDKDINTYSMRVQEWYGWHFPELKALVPDIHDYAALVRLIQDKKSLDESRKHEIAALVKDDEDLANSIIHAAKMSMGQDLSEIDMETVTEFADRVVAITEFRAELQSYLRDKMATVAPNLSELIGEVVGARLISQAGSLTSLAKYPASTVQILGAEKALFRALKTKGNTPKYGIIFNSSFIGKAGAKNKGRISRFLANKCTIATRIDSFAENPSNVFGQVLKQQVEDRLEFFDTGKTPIRNVDAMKAALDRINVQLDDEDMSHGASSASDSEKETLNKQKKKKEKREKKLKEPAPSKHEKDKKEKKEKKREKKHKRADDDNSARKKSKT